MACCGQCTGIEREFDRKTAARELKRYRRAGPTRSTRLLLEALRAADGFGRMRTLLDIGGGVGTLHHELLDSGMGAGVESAVHVDASTAYLAAAREEAERRGHVERVEFRHGDFVELAGGLDDADMVTLDRVICCYPAMEELVGRSVARARELYGLVYPRPVWWVRFGIPLANLWFQLRRSPFRVFLHPPEQVDAVVRRGGFERRSEARTWLWQVVVYGRAGAGPVSR